jgi:hypothetical protein
VTVTGTSTPRAVTTSAPVHEASTLGITRSTTSRTLPGGADTPIEPRDLVGHFEALCKRGFSVAGEAADPTAQARRHRVACHLGGQTGLVAWGSATQTSLRDHLDDATVIAIGADRKSPSPAAHGEQRPHQRDDEHHRHRPEKTPDKSEYRRPAHDQQDSAERYPEAHQDKAEPFPCLGRAWRSAAHLFTHKRASRSGKDSPLLVQTHAYLKS